MIRKLSIIIMLVAAAQTLAAAIPPDKVSELPEVFVYPEDRPVLHLNGYIREYSTLTSWSDTVFLYREKMVDFMLPSRKIRNFQGWDKPRLLASKSYYRFTNCHGLDSVSDNFGTHFSWSDWMELPGPVAMAEKLRSQTSGTDTVRDRFAVSRIWEKQDENASVNINLLADTLNQAWLPSFSHSYINRVDFDKVNVGFSYEDADTDVLTPEQLTGCTMHIKSQGRGYDLSRTFRTLGPVQVETKAELYFTDKQYITLKEARKLAKKQPQLTAQDIVAPPQAGRPSESISQLMAKVDHIDHDAIRMGIVPDQRLAGFDDLFKTRRSFWQQVWDIISPPTYNVNTTTYPGIR